MIFSYLVILLKNIKLIKNLYVFKLFNLNEFEVLYKNNLLTLNLFFIYF